MGRNRADTASRLDHPGFWRLLQDKRIRLYTIGLGWELQEYQPKIASFGERVLGHAAMATNGRFYFARTADELQGLYQQIAEELRTVSTYYVRPTLSRGPGSLQVVATGERIPTVSAPPQVELILDASGSMKRKLGGRMMIDDAKDAMVQIIEGLPDDLQVALRIAGTDLALRTLGSRMLESYLLRRVDADFLKTAADVDRHFNRLRSQLEGDLRYPVNEIYCYADAWQAAVVTLAPASDVVLLDLRGFTRANRGCEFELMNLVWRVPLARVVVLADRTTDEGALRDVVQAAWETLPVDSPNVGATAPRLSVLALGKSSKIRPVPLALFQAAYESNVGSG